MSKNVQKPMVLLFLGICPMVAVTGTVLGALGMAAAMLAVMLLGNVTLWALRKVIPQSVRVPAILLVTAFYVTAAQMTMNALLPTIYQALGIYLAVTAVNLLVVDQAEQAMDGGFGGAVAGSVLTALCLAVMLLVTAALREVFGSASFAGMPIEWLKNYTVPMLSQVPGGLLAAGIVAAVVQKIWPAKIQGHGVAFAAAGIEDEEAGK